MPLFPASRGAALCLVAAATLLLAACSSGSCPTGTTPVGGLSQDDRCGGPITHVSKSGWRTEIHEGAVTVTPPAASFAPAVRYVSNGTRESMGDLELRSWAGDRRTLLLPGGAKLTMHGADDSLTRVSLYDGDESHQVDVVRQAITSSQVDAGIAARDEVGEADGEAAYLLDFFLVNAYRQEAAADGTVRTPIADVAIVGAQHPFAGGPYSGGEAYLPVAPSAMVGADVEGACPASGEVRGRLTQATAGQPIDYVSRSGDWVIKIDKHTITVTRVGDFFTWQVWGDPHENLNGKHIKDWLDPGLRRTLLLQDGTKITMHADGPDRVVHTTSIYDGPESHEIGNTANEVRHSCVDGAVALQREAQEPDGETAVLSVLRTGHSLIGAMFVANVYDEQPAGAGEPHTLHFSAQPLGFTGEGDVNRKQINDLFDDPRIGHT